MPNGYIDVGDGVNIQGDEGVDLVTIRGFEKFKGSNYLYEFLRGDGFYATDYADEIFTYGGADKICAGGGADNIDSGSGADTIDAGGGRDRVNSGSGDDVVRGEGGNDKIYGGTGNDILIGGEGNDTIYGQDGNDEIKGEIGDDKAYGNAGNDVLDLGDGNDRGEGGEGDDFVCGGAGNDKLYGDTNGPADEAAETGDGNDVMEGGRGNDKIYGEGGNDKIYGGVQSCAKDEHGNLVPDDVGDLEDGGNDQIWGGDGNDDLIGGGGNDTIYGGANDDCILGDDVLGVDGLVVDHDIYFGNDKLFGNSGDDRIDGGRGNDTIDGGIGADAIAGSAGNDTLTGGAGADEFIFRQFEGGAGQRDTIKDFGNGADTIILWGQRSYTVTKIEEYDAYNNLEVFDDILVTLSDGNEILLLDVASDFDLDGKSYLYPEDLAAAKDAGPDGWLELVFYSSPEGDDCVIDCDVPCCPEVEDPGPAWTLLQTEPEV